MDKILHILPLSTRGGVETMFINYLKEMKYRNPNDLDKQIVFALSLSEDFKKELDSLQITYYVNEFNIKSNKLFKKLFYLIKNNDIKYLYGQNFLGNLVASICKLRFRSLKFVAHEHGSAWSESTKVHLLNFMWIRLSDEIICNSNAAKFILENKYHANSRKVSVVYNGVPRKSLLEKKKKNQLLFIGRLVNIKSTITVLEALPKVLEKENDMQLVILGDGPLKSNLMKKAQDLGIQSNIKFKGNVNNVEEYISESKLLVIPSIREPLGNVIIEAAMQKVPSIGTNVDGIPEVIIDGYTGKLISPTEAVLEKNVPKFVYSSVLKKLVRPKKINHNILADSIIDLLESDCLESYGDRAREHVLNKFDLKIYYETINNKF